MAVQRSTRRTRLFVDYWNFQLSWSERAGPRSCDWRALPRAITDAGSTLLAAVGSVDVLYLEEALLYASVDPTAEENVRRWLVTFVNRLPGWRVNVRERGVRRRQVHCRQCAAKIDRCPNCSAPYLVRTEKGVDAAIVTDLMSLAWQDAYDVAILVSSDADFVPAVERVQDKGLKVINAAWRGRGNELRSACWGSFDLDRIVGAVARPEERPTPT